MQILLLGRQSPDHRMASDVLSAAGHTIGDCFPGPASWACRGLDGPCPLDGFVDVAVATRQPDEHHHDSQGAVCARRRRVPLVAIGADEGDPIRRIADAVVAEPDGTLAETCDRLGGGLSGQHTRVARRALADVVHPGEAVEVTVSREPRRVRVLLRTSVEDRARRNLYVERVRAALARFDPYAGGISVSVFPLDQG